MFVSVPASPAFPPADALLSFLRSVNYKSHFIPLVLLAATVAAVLVAVSTFLYRNARAFWAAHGETIQFQFALFVERLELSIEKVYQLGAASRPVLTRWFNWLLDRAFYQLAA